MEKTLKEWLDINQKYNCTGVYILHNGNTNETYDLKNHSLFNKKYIEDHYDDLLDFIGLVKTTTVELTTLERPQTMNSQYMEINIFLKENSYAELILLDTINKKTGLEKLKDILKTIPNQTAYQYRYKYLEEGL